MIDRNEGIIKVLDSINNERTVNVIFSFEVPEFKKRYIAYTFEAESDKEDIDVLISEMDYDTYEIKKIPIEEIDLVLEYYNTTKELLLKKEGE